MRTKVVFLREDPDCEYIQRSIFDTINGTETNLCVISDSNIITIRTLFRSNEGQHFTQ